MKHIELILDAQGMSHERREDTDNIILRRAKIKMLAYKGKFDKYCKPWDIAQAREGFCPPGFEVHHIIPLCCSNTRIELDNMVVIDKKAHKWLHTNIYTPALMKCEPGQFCYVSLPDMDTKEVITWRDILPFICSFERNTRRISDQYLL